MRTMQHDYRPGIIDNHSHQTLSTPSPSKIDQTGHLAKITTMVTRLKELALIILRLIKVMREAEHLLKIQRAKKNAQPIRVGRF